MSAAELQRLPDAGHPEGFAGVEGGVEVRFLDRVERVCVFLRRIARFFPGESEADDTMVASYELGGGWMKIAPAKIGKRSFLGNSGMTAAGRNVPKNSLVAVLSATPAKAKSGTSWLGSPPVRLRRTAIASDTTLTFQPRLRLKVARALWELCRFVPVILTVRVTFALR